MYMMYVSVFLADFDFLFRWMSNLKRLNVLLPSNWTQEEIRFQNSMEKIHVQFVFQRNLYIFSFEKIIKKRCGIGGYEQTCAINFLVGCLLRK